MENAIIRSTRHCKYQSDEHTSDTQCHGTQHYSEDARPHPTLSRHIFSDQSGTFAPKTLLDIFSHGGSSSLFLLVDHFLCSLRYEKKNDNQPPWFYVYIRKGCRLISTHRDWIDDIENPGVSSISLAKVFRGYGCCLVFATRT